jgi:hypothetical protein
VGWHGLQNVVAVTRRRQITILGEIGKSLEKERQINLFKTNHRIGRFTLTALTSAHVALFQKTEKVPPLCCMKTE